MIDAIDKSKDGEVIFTKSKSIFFKYMKIRRIYDAENQTLLYVSYSTKETSGSFKHSLSTVPLWGTEAYKKPLPPLGDANQQKFWLLPAIKRVDLQRMMPMGWLFFLWSSIRL